MVELYKQFIDYLSSIDTSSKNFLEDMPILYDMETIQGVSNTRGDIGSYWINKKGYCGYEYDEMYTSKNVFGPRGESYYLVLVKDNKIVAFGDEQGNYAGGVYCSNDFNYEHFIDEKESLKKHYPDLYEQIKDIPLASKNEYPYHK
jgi:hypothetical protein